MLNTTRVCFCEFLQTLDIRDIWDAVMPRGNDKPVKLLRPPVIIRARLPSATECEHPFPRLRILDSLLDCGAILDQILIAMAIEQVLYVLPDNRIVPKRGIGAVQIDRPLRSNLWNALLGILHDGCIDVRLHGCVRCGIREPLLG